MQTYVRQDVREALHSILRKCAANIVDEYIAVGVAEVFTCKHCKFGNAFNQSVTT